MHLAESYETVGETGYIRFIILLTTSCHACSLGLQFQEEGVWVKYSTEHV